MTVSEQIIEVLNALCDKFGLAIDWTGQNVLPYAQELAGKMVSYELWTSVAWIFWVGIVCFLCYFIGWKITKTKDFEWDPDELVPYIAFTLILAGCIFGIAFIFVTLVQIMDIINCLTFPEKIVFTTIQHMMQ